MGRPKKYWSCFAMWHCSWKLRFWGENISKAMKYFKFYAKRCHWNGPKNILG
jgi:hypothetical protein